MLYQTAYTRTRAFRLESSSSLCAHRAPRTHAGQVGDTSRTSRVNSESALKRALSSDTSRRSSNCGSACAVTAKRENDGGAALNKSVSVADESTRAPRRLVVIGA